MHIFEFKQFDVIVLEMGLFGVLDHLIFEVNACLCGEVWQDELLYQQIFTTLFVDGFNDRVVYIIISLQDEIFNEIVVMEKSDQMLGAICVDVVVLKVQ